MKKDYYEETLDTLLAEFARKQFVTNEDLSVITNGLVHYEHEMLPFLVEEGMLNKSYNGYNITARGCVLCRRGGYKATRRKERRDTAILWFSVVCSAIAALTGILTIILA